MSLAGLGALFSTANSVKSTKLLSEAMGGLNKAAESGAISELKDVLELTGNLPVVLAPFKVLMAQLQAGTTEASINLMNRLFELMNSPAAQTLIEKFIDLLNNYINNAATIVETTSNLMTLIDKLPAAKAALDGMESALNGSNNMLTQFTNALINEFNTAMADGVLTVEETSTGINNALQAMGLEKFASTALAAAEDVAQSDQKFKTWLESFKTVIPSLIDNFWDLFIADFSAKTGMAANKAETGITILIARFELVLFGLMDAMLEKIGIKNSGFEGYIADLQNAIISLNASLQEATTSAETTEAAMTGLATAMHNLEGQQ